MSLIFTHGALIPANQGEEVIGFIPSNPKVRGGLYRTKVLSALDIRPVVGSAINPCDQGPGGLVHGEDMQMPCEIVEADSDLYGQFRK